LTAGETYPKKVSSLEFQNTVRVHFLVFYLSSEKSPSLWAKQEEGGEASGCGHFVSPKCAGAKRVFHLIGRLTIKTPKLDVVFTGV
jgi:hypothetical protein